MICPYRRSENGDALPTTDDSQHGVLGSSDTSVGDPEGRTRRRRRSSLWRDWRTYFGLAVVVTCIMVGVGASWLAPFDPRAIGVGPTLADPSSTHLLGTDIFGRDFFSRFLFGAQASVLVAIVVGFTATLAGLPFGLLLGYAGGRIDLMLSRVLDAMFAFPGLLLALVMVTVLGPGTRTVIVALSLIYVPIVARFVRGATAAEMGLPYVLSARISGASHLRVMFSHLLPNIASQVLVIGSLVMAYAVLAEAGLSFLGLGAQPPDGSWGRLLTENRGYLASHPHLVFAPGGAITVFVLGLSLLGDSLRDHLDPRISQMRVAP